MPLPAGPSDFPALQLLRWIRDPFGLLEECQRRFGDAFTLRVPGPASPFVIVASPEAVKDVFALDAEVGHAGKANVVLKPLLGEHSIILLDGPEHARQRRMMLPSFHGDRLAAYGRTMTDLAHEAIDRLPVGDVFPIVRSMQAITLQVIIRTVFGLQAGRGFAELTDVLARAVDAAARPMFLLPFMQRDLGPLSPWGRFLRSGAKASEILRGEIRRGRAEGTAGRTDVLAMLLDARDEAGSAMSEDEIHDELVTLLVAGHETTATALAWALRWLWVDAPLVERLRAEIATAGGEPLAIAKLELLDRTVRCVKPCGSSPSSRSSGGCCSETPPSAASRSMPEGSSPAPSTSFTGARRSIPSRIGSCPTALPHSSPPRGSGCRSVEACEGASGPRSRCSR
jgi:cytochrome P450